MALNFPPTPNVGDQHTEQGKTWEWDGTAWVIQSGGGSTLPPQIEVDPAGPVPSMSIDDDGRVLVGTDTALSEGTNAQHGKFQMLGNTSNSAGAAIVALGRGEAAASITAGKPLGYISFTDNTGNTYAEIGSNADAAGGSGNYPGLLTFKTTAAGSATQTERLRISSDGTLQLRNSPGIDFSQIQTNATGVTSETLDSYEEGTWTPTFGGLTVASPTATYTKVGRTVNLYIGFTPSTSGTWASMDNFTITNLPFTPSGDAVGWCSFSMNAGQQAHFLGSGGNTMFFVCTATPAGVNKNIFAPLRVVYNV